MKDTVQVNNPAVFFDNKVIINYHISVGEKAARRGLL
jgi:hypothetical protein